MPRAIVLPSAEELGIRLMDPVLLPSAAEVGIRLE